MRGATAVLTPAGAARVAQLHAAHLESIQRHVFEHIGDLDLAALAFGLEKVADSMIYAPALAQVASAATTTAAWAGTFGDEML